VSERTREDWGRVAESLPGFTHTMPWARCPDQHGRVYRRNWCTSDSGFGHTQVAGRMLWDRRDSSCPIDPDDPGNAGCLLRLWGHLGYYHEHLFIGPTDDGWTVMDYAAQRTQDFPVAHFGRALVAVAEALGEWPCGYDGAAP